MIDKEPQLTVYGDALSIECVCGETIEPTKYWEEEGFSMRIGESFRPCSECGKALKVVLE